MTGGAQLHICSSTLLHGRQSDSAAIEISIANLFCSRWLCMGCHPLWCSLVEGGSKSSGGGNPAPSWGLVRPWNLVPSRSPVAVNAENDGDAGAMLRYRSMLDYKYTRH